MLIAKISKIFILPIPKYTFSVLTYTLQFIRHFLFLKASGDQDAEPGARLTCQILLRLFKTSDMNTFSWYGNYGKTSSCNIKSSCDKHLLTAAHDSISVGPVLAVLKAMLVLSKC